MALKGGDKHLRRLKRLSGEAVLRIAGAVVQKGAEDIRTEARHLITAGSASGQSGGKHQHIRSRPGEPPNNEFGTLESHIEDRRTGPTTAEVTSNADHANPLEFGTSRMAARPYMRPARDKMVPKIERDFADAIQKLKKAAGR